MFNQLLNNAPDELKQTFNYKLYNKGQMILMPGEQNNHLYILVSGEAQVYRQNLDGVVINLKTFKPFSYFGEVEIFDKDKRTLAVIASTDCKVCIISAEVLFKWMQVDFEVTKYMMKELSNKMTETSHMTARLTFLSVKDRLLYSLLMHHKMGDLKEVTKETLCFEVYAPRRSINRAIASCVKERWIDYDTCFEIVDVKKLITYTSQLID